MSRGGRLAFAAAAVALATASLGTGCGTTVAAVRGGASLGGSRLTAPSPAGPSRVGTRPGQPGEAAGTAPPVLAARSGPGTGATSSAGTAGRANGGAATGGAATLGGRPAPASAPGVTATRVYIGLQRERCFKLEAAASYPVSSSNLNDESIAAQSCDVGFFLQLVVNRLTSITNDAFIRAVEGLGTTFGGAVVYGTRFLPDRRDGADLVEAKYLASCTCLKYSGAPSGLNARPQHPQLVPADAGGERLRGTLAGSPAFLDLGRR